jgi:hypothetical protein
LVIDLVSTRYDNAKINIYNEIYASILPLGVGPICTYTIWSAKEFSRSNELLLSFFPCKGGEPSLAKYNQL